MKSIKYIILVGLIGSLSSCVSDLLDRNSTTEVSSELFWTNVDDALSATYGVYNATRTLFETDYYYDGHGEFQNTRGKSVGSISSWSPSGSSTSGFNSMWKNAYAVINRANVTIMNVEVMLENEKIEANKNALERIMGECRFMRALAYFRLIQNWGDVPYYTHVLEGNAEANSMSRTSIDEIKTGILDDLQYASTTLPDPNSLKKDERGRATQTAALAFKGKVELFWASWKKNGWPELNGFTQDANEANTYYKLAAADFYKVIYNYGLELFGSGDPGVYQTPTYWKLFQPENEYVSEIIFSIQYGGPLLNQGESLMRDFGTRSTANAQCWIMPTHRLVDRYQSCITGDFLPNLVLDKNTETPNGSLNQESYYNRDWRMRSTLLWNEQKMLGLNDEGMTLVDSLIWRYGTRTTAGFINNDASSQTGYIYRKWIRQETGASRTDGSQDLYLMRLADVYLMYCEAVNETEGPSATLVGLIDQIRKRGNLPGLAPAKYANSAEFFKAIEQERIVELATEGQRPFDIRRWRKAKEVWGPANGDGWTLYDTNGGRVRDEFKNASEIDFGKYYIYQIDEKERGRNPNLTQNTPWL